MANLAKKGILCILFIVFLLSSAEPCFGEDISAFSLIGLRVGLWRMSSADVKPDIGQFSASTKTVSPYGEVFFAHGLKKGFLVELSLGSCDRGETRFELEDGYGYYWESLVIYPISVGGSFYPLSFKPQISWQPYLDL